ncbi:MAG: tryptophan-rich sensory protein [Candidatus Woesearchaeota archaeon]|nr:MAG: tryptophan-rich sensory protein [Candidatus Woesearchaeota archaeon]
MLGFIEIVVLWDAILLTIILFYQVSLVAAILLIPYVLWVSFAAIANLATYLLNAN